MPSFELNDGYYDTLSSQQLDGWQRFEKKKADPVVVTAIDTFVASLPKNARVLDVASGAGIEAIVLQQAGAQVFLMDLSEKMLEKTAQNAQAAQETRHLDKRVQANVFKMPFPNKTFDGIYSKDLLSLAGIDERKEMLTSFYNLLRIGGRVLILLEEIPTSTVVINYKEISGKMEDILRGAKPTDRLNEIRKIESTAEIFIPLLKEVGFSNVTAITKEKPTSRWVRHSPLVIIEATKGSMGSL